MIIEINTKSDFIKVVNDKPSGIPRKYLVTDIFKNKLEKIVFVASVLKKQESSNVFIEMKYPLGRRDKRIEIVTIENKVINICKIVKMNDFDESYFELLSIINDANNKQNTNGHTIKGVLIFLNEYNTEVLQKFMLNQDIQFQHFNISNFK
jgi:hypothetical protein